MIVPELQRILFKSQKQDVKTIWDKLPKEVQIYVFKKIREKNCVDLGKLSTICFKVAYNCQSNELKNSKYGQKTGKK